ncbi:hypothetical protein ACNZ70_001721 [Vibrio mimicus]
MFKHAKKLYYVIMPLSAIILFGCNSEGYFTSKNDHVVKIEIRAVNPVNGVLGDDQLAVGFPMQYEAFAFYDNGQGPRDVTKIVEWKSTDVKVATINSHGIAHAEMIGHTEISALLREHVSNQLSLDVEDAHPIVPPGKTNYLDITVERNGVTVVPAPLQHAATIMFDNGTNQDLTNFVDWSSSSPDVGEMNARGLLSTETSTTGNTEVSAQFQGYESNILTDTVVNKDDISDIKLKIVSKASSIPIGTSERLSADVCITILGLSSDYCGDVTDHVDWLGGSHIEMDKTILGRAKAKALGKDEVKADFFGLASDTLLLEAVPAVIENISVIDFPSNDTTISLAKGISKPLEAIAHYQQESDIPLDDKIITPDADWSSNDTSLVTVSNLPGSKGNITAGKTKLGNTEVFATLGGIQGSINVNITGAVPTSFNIIDDAVVAGQEKQLRARLIFSDDTNQLIETNDVSWTMMSSSTDVNLSAKGYLKTTIGHPGNINVKAMLSNNLGLSGFVDASIDINESMPRICGRNINDKTESPWGNCLKVLENDNGDLYSSTPSFKVMNNTPNLNVIPTFKLDELHSDGDFDIKNNFAGIAYGDYKSYCQTLSDLKFAGQSNWTPVTVDDITMPNVNALSNINDYGLPKYYSNGLSFDKRSYYYHTNTSSSIGDAFGDSMLTEWAGAIYYPAMGVQGAFSSCVSKGHH